jgi:hypothetical protein
MQFFLQATHFDFLKFYRLFFHFIFIFVTCNPPVGASLLQPRRDAAAARSALLFSRALFAPLRYNAVLRICGCQLKRILALPPNFQSFNSATSRNRFPQAWAVVECFAASYALHARHA